MCVYVGQGHELGKVGAERNVLRLGGKIDHFSRYLLSVSALPLSHSLCSNLGTV